LLGSYDRYNQMHRQGLRPSGDLLPLHGYRWVASILLYDFAN
jgi:hypothetical protein